MSLDVREIIVGAQKLQCNGKTDIWGYSPSPPPMWVCSPLHFWMETENIKEILKTLQINSKRDLIGTGFPNSFFVGIWRVLWLSSRESSQVHATTYS
jgi:hypothetical protein